MNKNDLQQFVQNNPHLVKIKSTSNPNLFVLKYTNKVFFDSLWNEYLEECRGTIVDKDFNIVSYPFTKIYNYGIESRAPKLSDDTVITTYRKINGFMAAVTWHNDNLLVSTTGSIDSDFVKYVYDLIDINQYSAVCKEYPNLTFMFECVHENDPHIIPEVTGMYLLGYREKDWESTIAIDQTMYISLVEKFKCFKVESHTTTMAELLKSVKHVKHEGFVFYTQSGQAAKIKTPYYLIQKALARKKDILSLSRSAVDEEYYPLVSHLNSIKDAFNEFDEQARLKYIRYWLQTNHTGQ